IAPFPYIFFVTPSYASLSIPIISSNSETCCDNNDVKSFMTKTFPSSFGSKEGSCPDFGNEPDINVLLVMELTVNTSSHSDTLDNNSLLPEPDGAVKNNHIGSPFKRLAIIVPKMTSIALVLGMYNHL